VASSRERDRTALTPELDIACLLGPSLIAMSGWDHLPGLRAAATWQRLAVGSAPECLAECWQLYGEVQGFCAAPP
jgi:hypothetical protein